jgi:hypothetical protein
VSLGANGGEFHGLATLLSESEGLLEVFNGHGEPLSRIPTCMA